MALAHDPVSIFRFLFRLTARVNDLGSEEFLHRLVVGLANRYGATSCSIVRRGRIRMAASAPVAREMADLSKEHRAYVDDLDERLVREAILRQSLVSALDLDADGGIHAFLADQLPDTDIFALPLVVCEGASGAIVIHLSKHATSLSETDLQALMSIGEVLLVAEERLLARRRSAASPAKPQKRSA